MKGNILGYFNEGTQISKCAKIPCNFLETGGARQHSDQMFKFSYLEDRHALLILQQQKIGPFDIFLIDRQ